MHKTILCNPEYVIFEATDGNKALSILSENSIDLILLDYQMPGMNGIEILDIIRHNKKTKKIPVIMVSSLTNRTDIDMSLKKGASTYIHKPVLPGTLLKEVHSFLN